MVILWPLMDVSPNEVAKREYVNVLLATTKNKQLIFVGFQPYNKHYKLLNIDSNSLS